MNPVAQIALSSILPALLALGGILYGQHKAVESAESEGQREQMRWVRESRKEAYVALLQECEALYRWAAMYFNVGFEGEKKEYRKPSPDWMKEAYAHLTTVEVFASETAGAAAGTMVEATSELDGSPGAGMHFSNAVENFRKQAQADLNLRVTSLGKTEY
ncbi:hypothetical protein [Arthrobacter rhombi]|uniref:hypothetical protein n=1 Tax=Arthrobacter rhombi TaxID=71253 RepID=UPI00264F6386|nr:hypothetical protein [Micrococcaceae bacterium]